MKIAFLFMIYDIIEKEDIWFNFFLKADPEKYTIYIHGKDNSKIKLKNDFFKNFIIEKNYPTDWAGFNLVYLQNRLFELAIMDDKNYKFVLLSGTHIPLHNFDFIYDFLTKNNFSYLSHEHYKNQTSSLIDRFKTINNYKNFNLNDWHYASQWSILNRNIVSYILNNENEFNKIFSISKFSDEYAYINFIIENKMYKNFINKKTTFISGVQSIDTKKYRGVPHTFDNNELDKKLINNIRSSYLFMRKIVSTCKLEEKWIFFGTENFKLSDKKIKLNKESFPKIGKEEYDKIKIKLDKNLPFIKYNDIDKIEKKPLIKNVEIPKKIKIKKI